MIILEVQIIAVLTVKIILFLLPQKGRVTWQGIKKR